MCWRLKLRDYHYEIVYKSGKTNKNADALSRNPPETDSEPRIHEIRISPITPEPLKRKRGRPRKKFAEILSTTSTCDESDNLVTDSGIAARVRERNQNKSRPNYKETTFKRYHRLASESSESESSFASTPRTTRRTLGKMTKYEDDDKSLSPALSKGSSISLKSFFREKEPVSDTSAIEMVVEIDPTSVIPPSPELNNEIHSEELQDESEYTLQEENSQSSTLKILPPEHNPSNSESVYSGTDCET